ncbi:MAG: hypothetical protein V4850_01670 [Myxococcota bacterium]
MPTDPTPALAPLVVLAVLVGAGAAGGLAQSLARLLPSDGASLTAVKPGVWADLAVRAGVGVGAALLIPVLPLDVKGELLGYVAYGILAGFAGPAVLTNAAARIGAMASELKVKRLEDGLARAGDAIADVESALTQADQDTRDLNAPPFDAGAARARLAEIRAQLERLRSH